MKCEILLFLSPHGIGKLASSQRTFGPLFIILLSLCSPMNLQIHQTFYWIIKNVEKMLFSRLTLFLLNQNLINMLSITERDTFYLMTSHSLSLLCLLQFQVTFVHIMTFVYASTWLKYSLKFYQNMLSTSLPLCSRLHCQAGHSKSKCKHFNYFEKLCLFQG